MGPMECLTPRERRLRRALIGVSMLAAVTLLAIAGVLFYWWMYLLGPEGSPFTRGPYLLRVDRDSAELRWRTDGDRDVRLTALDGTGREVVGIRNATEGLFEDTVESAQAKLADVESAPVQTLADAINADLEAGRPVHILAHSQGAIVTAQALEEVNQRLLDQGLTPDQESEFARLEEEQRTVGDLARDLTRPRRSDGEE